MINLEALRPQSYDIIGLAVDKTPSKPTQLPLFLYLLPGVALPYKSGTKLGLQEYVS